MEDNPYTPPSLTHDPAPLQSPDFLPPATLSQRFCASLLDSLIIYGPLLAVTIFLPIPFLNSLVESEDFLSDALFSFLGFLIFVGLNSYLLTTRDQTIGKMALRIKVVDQQGK